MQPTHQSEQILPSPAVRAAEYLRMSTEGQQYSIAYQQLAIRQYALVHGMTVVQTYADEGISGLTLDARPALIQLLADVQNHRANFKVILVYDVSRWGRFQDIDESAHYEYLCRKAGFRVEYCAEPFTNDSGPLTAIYKHMKRVMAAEYSREQSVRVFRAVSQAAKRGYFTGGKPGLGFQRVLVGPNGVQKGILSAGVRRDIRGDHMILVPGPDIEIKMIRRIFHLFVVRGFSPQKIADAIHGEFKRRYHSGTIRLILRNERYVGTSLYNRQSRKLKGMRKSNPRSDWITVPNAYKAIVSLNTFEKAQAIIELRKHRQHTEESLLNRLRFLLKKHGYLSTNIIRADANPDFVQYRRKFGGARQIWARLGYTQILDNHHDIPRELRVKQILAGLREELATDLRRRGHTVKFVWPSRLITVDAVTVAMNAAPYVRVPQRKSPSPKPSSFGWYLYCSRKYAPDLTIIIRLDQRNEQVLDYFIAPGALVAKRRVWLSQRNLENIHAIQCGNFSDVLEKIREKGSSQFCTPEAAPLKRQPAKN